MSKIICDLKGGVPGTKVHLVSVYQEMPSSAEWSQFLHNNENKTSLISLMVEYFCSEEGRSTLKYPLIITGDEYTYKVTNDVVESLFPCSHEEVDSRIIYHASVFLGGFFCIFVQGR